jgi:hypothetical protein
VPQVNMIVGILMKRVIKATADGIIQVVINTASGFHTGAAKALVLGLGQRRKATGKDVYYFHVSRMINFLSPPHTDSSRQLELLTLEINQSPRNITSLASSRIKMTSTPI